MEISKSHVPVVQRCSFNDFSCFFNEVVSPNGEFYNKTKKFVFRGESSNSYSLIPSAFRDEELSNLWMGIKTNQNMEGANRRLEYWQIYAEYYKLRDFYRIANQQGLQLPKIRFLSESSISRRHTQELIKYCEYRWPSQEMAELAALAQHYGLPTRLLDWTFDLCAAMYFASVGALQKVFKGENEKNEKMVIWALDATTIQSFDGTKRDIPLKFVVPPYAENPNLCAQKGILSFWLRDFGIKNFNSLAEVEKLHQPVELTSLDRLLEKFVNVPKTLLYKFEIPITECDRMFEYISRCGYCASKLFPGYKGVVTDIQQQALVSLLNSD